MPYPISFRRFMFCLAAVILTCAFEDHSVIGQSEEQNAAQPPTIRSPYFGEVGGMVVDAGGKPVADATVIYRRPPLPGRPESNKFQTSTDSNGQFSFPADLGMPGRQASITVVHPDYVVALQSLSMSNLNPDRTNLEIRLNEGITIGGRIVDFDGEPVPDVQVSLFAPYDKHFDSDHSTAVTDSSGHFKIHHAPNLQQLSLQLKRNGVILQSVNWLSKTAQEPSQTRFPGDVVIIGGPVYFRDGSSYRLPGMFRAKLTARDSRTGQPVDLGWAGCKAMPRGSIFQRSQQRPGDLKAEFTFVNIGYGRYRFFCEPEEDSGLLGAFFDTTFTKKSTDLNKQVDFVPGAMVRGKVVDRSTSRPIPNVKIKYLPANIEQFEQKGILPQFSTSTAQDGRFEILVPHVLGELRMVGEVPGYVTLPDFNDPLPPQLAKQFSRSISPGPGEKISDIHFQLAPAPKVRATVVGPDGNPPAGVSYVATHFREKNNLGSYIAGRTDDRGRLETDSMFDDATFPYDQPPERIKQRIRQGARVGDIEPFIKRNQIWCWNDDNSLCGSIVVHRDDAGEDLVIKMSATTSVRGRVVDKETGQALPEVPVTANSAVHSLRLDFRWSTMTNQEGVFTLTGLFPEMSYDLSIGLQHGLQDYKFEATEFKTTNLPEPLDLRDIGGINISILNRPIDVVDVSALPDEEALDKLVEFVTKAMKDSPPVSPKSWSPTQPASRYRKKLAIAIGPQVKLLATRHPNSDFLCKVYLEIVDVFAGDAGNLRNLPHPVEWIDQARLDLINNIDREGVFEAYKRIRWSLSSTIFESAIMKQSKKREIRAWAYRELLQEYSFGLVHACTNEMYTAEQFDARLKQVEKFWKQGIDEFGDFVLPAPFGSTMEEYVHTMIKRIGDKVQRDRRYEKSRVKRVLELVKKFEPKKKI